MSGGGMSGSWSSDELDINPSKERMDRFLLDLVESLNDNPPGTDVEDPAVMTYFLRTVARLAVAHRIQPVGLAACFNEETQRFGVEIREGRA